MRTLRTFTFGALGIIAARVSLQAQIRTHASNRGKCVIPASGELPRYEVRQLTTTEVGTLRQHLRDECWEAALELYFKKYRSDLGDWVVFIDSLGKVHQGFTSRGDTSSTFKEQRYVWAVVFMDRRPSPDFPAKPAPAPSPPPPLAELHIHRPGVNFDLTVPGASGGGSSGGADTVDMLFQRRVVAYHRSPIVNTLIALVGKAVGISAMAEDDLKDSTRTMRLAPVWIDDKMHDTLYVAFGRFGLIDNSQVDVDIVPTYGHVLAPDPAKRNVNGIKEPLTSVYAAMANARRHTFEMGVLAGMSRGARVATYNANQQITSEGSPWLSNGFVTVDVNLPGMWFPLPKWYPFYDRNDEKFYRERLRPRWQYASFGLFAGSNILHGTIGDELVAGLQIGHLIGDAGIAGGLNWVLSPVLKDGKVFNDRRARLLVGLDLRL